LYGEDPLPGSIYRVLLNQIDILDRHENCVNVWPISSCASPNWFLDIGLNHVTTNLLWDNSVNEQSYPLPQQGFPNSQLDFTLPLYGPNNQPGGDLWLHADGWVKNGIVPVERENKGESLPTGDWAALGANQTPRPLADLVNQGPQEWQPPGSQDWKLHYEVLPGSLPQIFDRFQGPPNCWSGLPATMAPSRTRRLSLKVPASALDSPLETGEVLAGTLFNLPWACGNIALIGEGSTVDNYVYEFMDDFAGPGAGPLADHDPLPAGITYSETPSPWDPDLPQQITSIVGYAGASVSITGGSGGGFALYSTRLRTSFRSVQADPHASVDPSHPQILDLISSGVGVDPYTCRTSQSNEVCVWSWQASEPSDSSPEGETHYYQIKAPFDPLPDRNCPLDADAGVLIMAFGMNVAISNAGGSFIDQADNNATAVLGPGDFPAQTGPILINLAVGSQRPQPGHRIGRKVYKLDIQYLPKIYYAPGAACAEAIAETQWLRENLKRLASDSGVPLIAAAQNITRIPPQFGDIPPHPGDPPLEYKVSVSESSNYAAVKAAGSTIDLVISSRAERPFSARLYADDGVLLKESSPMSISSGPTASEPDRSAARSRLSTDQLVQGKLYLLQLVPVPGASVNNGTSALVRVGAYVAGNP
jgi:hypothetical protein